MLNTTNKKKFSSKIARTVALAMSCVTMFTACGIPTIGNKDNQGADSQSTETEKKETETIEPVETVTEIKEEEPQFIQVGDVQFLSGFTAEKTKDTVVLKKKDDLIESGHAIVINGQTNEIVAQKAAKTVVSPASMTKILTVLVAAEHLKSMEALDDKFKITLEMTDFAYVNDCSAAGFLDGEKVRVRDLFYGTILPSGGEAAYALAVYTAGSHEAFVDMMNEKVEELGLSETAHFTNCVGLYHEDHHCTVYDMAMILKAAAANDWCREVLSTHIYTTSSTKKHPDGIVLSNLFLRRIEDYDTGGTVMCAKTGFVNQSGNCAASYQISDSGVPYIVVTTNGVGSWGCIRDQIALYKKFAK